LDLNLKWADVCVWIVGTPAHRCPDGCGQPPLQNQYENLTHFSIRDSGFKCDNCAKQDKSSIEILETTKDAIKYIILTDPKKIFSFDVPENSKKELDIVSKLYLTEKLEKEYKL